MITPKRQYDINEVIQLGEKAYQSKKHAFLGVSIVFFILSVFGLIILIFPKIVDDPMPFGDALIGEIGLLAIAISFLIAYFLTQEDDLLYRGCKSLQKQADYIVKDAQRKIIKEGKIQNYKDRIIKDIASSIQTPFDYEELYTLFRKEKVVKYFDLPKEISDSDVRILVPSLVDNWVKDHKQNPDKEVLNYYLGNKKDSRDSGMGNQNPDEEVMDYLDGKKDFNDLSVDAQTHFFENIDDD